MGTRTIDLGTFIAMVEGDAPGDRPLDQLAAAAELGQHLASLNDDLVGHFVERARRAGCSWSQIGGALGVSRQAVHQRFQSDAALPDLTRFTAKALHVVSGHATDRAAGLGHPFIGTEHLLLAAYDEATSVASEALVALGLHEPAAVDAVLRLVERGEAGPEARRSYTPRAARVLEQAIGEASERGHDYVGTEHLLLALSRAGGSVAGRVLAAVGIGPEQVDAEVRRLLSERAAP